MPNIKPVSDLRNYNEVLRDIAVGEPVFLTKNGRGRYAILDMREYEKTKARTLRSQVTPSLCLVKFSPNFIGLC